MCDKYADFWQVTGEALDYTCAALGLELAPNQHHRLPRAQCALPAASAAHLKLFFGINASYLFVVHGKTFPRDHHVDTTATKPSAFPRNSLNGIS